MKRRPARVCAAMVAACVAFPLSPGAVAAAPAAAAAETSATHLVPVGVVLTGHVDEARIDHFYDDDLVAELYRREVDGSLTRVGRGAYGRGYTNGAFAFHDAMPGYDYTVVVRDAAHPERGSTWLGDTTTSAGATFVRPSGSLPVDLGTITPQVGTRWLTGRCLDSAGAPLDRCGSFDLWRRDPAGWHPVFSGDLGAAVDPNYDLGDDPFGALRARVGAEQTIAYQPRDGGGDPIGAPYFLGGARAVEQARTFTPTAGDGAFDVGDFTYDVIPPVRLTGRVLGPGDVPVAGIRVTARVGDGSTTDRTANDGTFELHGDAGRPARVTIDGSSAGLTTVTLPPRTLSAAVQDLGDISLASVPGYVTGTIRDSRGAPVRAKLDLYRHDPETGEQQLDPRSAYGIGASEASDGRWDVVDLDPGLYTIEARPLFDGGTDVPTRRRGSFRVTRAAAPLTGIDLTLERGAVVTGVVTGADGQPRQGIEVSLYAFNGTGEVHQTPFSDYYHGQTDAEGRYSVVTDRNAQVHVTANGHGESGAGHGVYHLGGGTLDPREQTATNSVDVGDGLTFDLALPLRSDRAPVGTTLRAQPGARPATAPPPTYQWFRDGVAVPGATGATLATDVDDLGHRFTVTAAGATSGEVRVVRTPSTTTVRPRPATIGPGRRATLAVAVATPGSLVPTGRVTITEGRRALARRTLDAAASGRVRVLLPRLRRPGMHRLVVTYSGAGAVLGSHSTVVRILQRRPRS